MWKFTFLCAYLFSCINCGLEPPSVTIATTQKSISTCVSSILKNHLRPKRLLVFSLGASESGGSVNSSGETYNYILHGIFAAKRWNLMTKKSGKAHNDTTNFKEKADAYVIVIMKDMDLQENLVFLSKTPSWNPHAKFILVTNFISKDWNAVSGVLMKEFWKYHIINAIMAVYEDSTRHFHLLTWFPYSQGHCGDQLHDFTELGVCKNGALLSEQQLFPNKIPSQLNGCPLIALAVFWPPFVIPPPNLTITEGKDIPLTDGLDILLLNTIGELMNLTIKFRCLKDPEDWGDVFKNGTITGAFKVLLDEEVDILIGGVYPRSSRHNIFDYTANYWQDVTCWVAPVADLLPGWRSLLTIITPFSFIVTIVTYVVMSVIVYIMSANTAEFTGYRNISGAFMKMWSMLLSMPVDKMATRNRLRIFLSTWIIFAMHLYAIYSTFLISVLTQPDTETQITNIEDLLNSEMSIGFLDGTQKFFEYTNLPTDKRILSKYKLCETAPECLKRVVSDKNFAFAVSTTYVDYNSHKYVDKNGKFQLIFFKEVIISTPIEMLLSRGFPLLERFNKYILRIKATGIMQKWKARILRKSAENYQNGEEAEKESNHAPNILTMSHLEGAFYLLMIGLGISTIIFCMELKLAKKQRKTKGYLNKLPFRKAAVPATTFKIIKQKKIPFTH